VTIFVTWVSFILHDVVYGLLKDQLQGEFAFTSN